MPFEGFDLTGRAAIVLGGTSGIGRALVDGLVAAGADVAASSRRQEQVDATARSIEERGRRTLRVAADVTDSSALAALARLGQMAERAERKLELLPRLAIGRARRRSLAGLLAEGDRLVPRLAAQRVVR